MNSNFNHQPEKVMTPDQFTQVVDAILEGKYSWACVLILRFAGYNPLHYIPYRTYNRLMKDHSQLRRSRIGCCAVERFPDDASHPGSQARIRDLSYLEPLEPLEPQANVKGGERSTLLISIHSIFAALKI